MEPFHCSPAAHRRLCDELSRIETEVLPALRAQVADTRTDSLSSTENYAAVETVAEYERAEAHARSLRDRLARAVVVEEASVDIAGVGTLVVLDVGEEWSVLIGSIDERSDDIDVVSPSSPLGEALLGKSVGSEVSWQTPSGAAMTARITALRLS